MLRIDILRDASLKLVMILVVGHFGSGSHTLLRPFEEKTEGCNKPLSTLGLYIPIP